MSTCMLSLTLCWFPTSPIFAAWYLDSWVSAFTPFSEHRELVKLFDFNVVGEIRFLPPALFFFSLRGSCPCSSQDLTSRVFKWSESLNVRWIPRPQTVWTSNSEKIGAEWFRTQSRKLSFPAGRMELTVILRLQKEHCPRVISLLSGSVDI